MSKRTPKALRDIQRTIEEFGITGDWVEGTKHHQFFVGTERVLCISKGGNSKPKIPLLRQTLQRFQRSHAA